MREVGLRKYSGVRDKRKTGVMEYWRTGVLVKHKQINTPLFQHSITPLCFSSCNTNSLAQTLL
jgi:hypothetical protein